MGISFQGIIGLGFKILKHASNITKEVALDRRE
jgi:hypothetical protein